MDTARDKEGEKILSATLTLYYFRATASKGCGPDDVVDRFRNYLATFLPNIEEALQKVQFAESVLKSLTEDKLASYKTRLETLVSLYVK